MDVSLAEIKNSAPIPGREPIAMLKNGEALPKSGFLFQASVDPDRKAARIIVRKGNMEWSKYPLSVHAEINPTEGQPHMQGVEIVYTDKNYAQANIEMYNRQGAGYSGIARSSVDNISASNGQIIIGPNFDNGVTLPMVIDEVEPSQLKDILRVFDVNDPQGPINAAKSLMEMLVGLPIADSQLIADLLQKKFSSAQK